MLLADDHQAVLDNVSFQLAGEFDVVAKLLDGQAALDAALALKPDAVVLDISMPRMSGLETARRLSELPNPPCIVFLTVHEDQDFIDAAESAGASGSVIKRHMSRDLVVALRRALRLPAPTS